MVPKEMKRARKRERSKMGEDQRDGDEGAA